MTRAAIAISLLLCCISDALAQNNLSTITVTNVTPLTIPTDASPRLFPSPDGMMVAFERPVRLNGHQDYYLCFQDITNSGPHCSLVLEQPPRGLEPDPNSRYLPLSWSPDGSQVAVVGQPLLTQSETGLLIYERGSDTWRNLGDGMNGESPAGTVLWAHPTWAPDGRTLAVERINIDSLDERAASLALVDVQSGEARALASLPGKGAEMGMVGSLAWSPDGTRLTTSILHLAPNPNSDGIWRIDVDTGESQRLVDLPAIETAFQDIYAETPLNLLGPVVWSPDGSRLMFWAGNTERRPPAVWTFVMEAQADGLVIPANLPVLPNDTPDRRTLRPLQAAWSPDSTALLMLAPGRDPAAPEVPLDPNDLATRMSLYLLDVNSNISTLVGHLPLTASTGLYPAAWSPSGNVIINGYALHLKVE